MTTVLMTDISQWRTENVLLLIVSYEKYLLGLDCWSDKTKHVIVLSAASGNHDELSFLLFSEIVPSVNVILLLFLILEWGGQGVA